MALNCQIDWLVIGETLHDHESLMPQIAQGEAKIDTEYQYLINHSEDIACYLSAGG